MFGSLLLIVELLFVSTIFSSKESGELASTFFKTHLVLISELFKTSLSCLLDDASVSFVLPLGSKGKILVTVDLG